MNNRDFLIKFRIIAACVIVVLVIAIAVLAIFGGNKEKTPEIADPTIESVLPDDTQTENAEHTHKYSSKITEPTCTEKGFTTHICECGDTYDDRKKDALGHDYERENVSPTCEKDGYVKYTCRRCEYTFTEVKEALGHDYTKTTVPAKNGEKAYDKYTCINCGHFYKDNYHD